MDMTDEMKTEATRILTSTSPSWNELDWLQTWGTPEQHQWAYDRKAAILRAQEEAKERQRQAWAAEHAKKVEAAKAAKERFEIELAALNPTDAEKNEVKNLIGRNSHIYGVEHFPYVAADVLAEARQSMRARHRARLVESKLPRIHVEHVFDQEPAESDSLKAARKWLPTGKTFLVLLGGVGTQKSGAAVWAAAYSGKSCYFITASGLRAAFGFSDEAQELYERLQKVDILIVDELGAENDTTGFLSERINDLLGHRYNERKRTVITANLNTKDFVARYERVADRARETGMLVELGGESVRKAMGQNNK